ncbi:Uncharacterised protein [Vibrio cholerae]|nr:Uncharacterised protein [Vibrio cholerae]
MKHDFPADVFAGLECRQAESVLSRQSNLVDRQQCLLRFPLQALSSGLCKTLYSAHRAKPDRYSHAFE